MKKHQKYISIATMLVIGLNMTSIIHHNILNAHFSFTVFAQEGESETPPTNPPSDDEETQDPDAETTEAAPTEEEVRKMALVLQNAVESVAEEERDERYDATLESFKTCIPTDIGDHENEICNADESTSDASFKRLLRSIANNEIRTVLEEPLGNENIFKRARVCKTKFLRDRFGSLQTITPTGIEDLDDIYSNSENVDTISSQYESVEAGTETETNFFSGKKFLITTDKCEEFYVKQCQPQNNEQTGVGEGDSLPITVSCDEVQVLFAGSGTELIKNYVGLIYRWAAGIIGVLAVVVIVIGGVRISQSSGDQSKVDAAKTSIIQSLVALAVLFLAGILLASINPNFFTQRDLQQNDNLQVTEPE